MTGSKKNHLMKKLIAIFIFSVVSVKSQSLQEFIAVSDSFKQSFDFLESKTGLIPVDTDYNFGLERRSYSSANFHMIAYERDDKPGIDEFALMASTEIENNKESWFNICKMMNYNPDYEFVESLLFNDDNTLSKKNIDFKNMIEILRSANNTEEYIYFITFKRKGVFYNMNVVNGKTLYRIKNNYTNQIKK